mmetsp:Transcript_15878/g.17921  ORF Transcript_15878/g.17921 Transcript_15878/m.17921 type:complete len:81 (-) Transcript_15878:389-631(-)
MELLQHLDSVYCVVFIRVHQISLEEGDTESQLRKGEVKFRGVQGHQVEAPWLFTRIRTFRATRRAQTPQSARILVEPDTM